MKFFNFLSLIFDSVFSFRDPFSHSRLFLIIPFGRETLGTRNELEVSQEM